MLLHGIAWSQVAAPPAAPTFTIQRFNVDGNSLLPQDVVDRLVAPHVGTGKDFGSVQQALEALQAEYEARGYTAVRVLVPEQELRTGQVRLQVIEARIRAVKLDGNKFNDQDNIRASLPALREGQPPNSLEIARNIQLVNENPNKQASIALEAADEPGKVDVVVKVTDSDPSRVTMFLDNSGNSSTGYHRVGVGYVNSNVANRDNLFTAQFITTPDNAKNVSIYGLGYRMPLYSLNAAVDLVAGHSNANSGVVQNLFTVSGSGSIFGARYTQILPKLDSYEHKLALGYDYRSFRSNVTLVGGGNNLVPEVETKPVSITYSGRYSPIGHDLSGFIGFSQNLPGGTDGGQTAFNSQRAGARSAYNVWRYGGGYTRLLEGDWLLRAALNGQYSRDKLISGEQFGMGGADSVRGFLEREAANDIGHRVSVEAYTPDWGSELVPRFGGSWRARALAFMDMAHGYDNLAARGANNGLLSTGIGLRLNEGKNISLRMDLAKVRNETGTREPGSWRMNFSASYSF